MNIDNDNFFFLFALTEFSINEITHILSNARAHAHARTRAADLG